MIVYAPGLIRLVISRECRSCTVSLFVYTALKVSTIAAFFMLIKSMLIYPGITRGLRLELHALTEQVRRAIQRRSPLEKVGHCLEVRYESC